MFFTFLARNTTSHIFLPNLTFYDCSQTFPDFLKLSSWIEEKIDMVSASGVHREKYIIIKHTKKNTKAMQNLINFAKGGKILLIQC